VVQGRRSAPVSVPVSRVWPPKVVVLPPMLSLLAMAMLAFLAFGEGFGRGPRPAAVQFRVAELSDTASTRVVATCCPW
ncbi:MAG TPA: hypothetical protein VI076_14135, partial [Actinopolymorphaceae bacterium]